MVHYLEKYSSTVQHEHLASSEGAERVSDWLEVGEEVGDDRAEGLSAIGDGGRVTTSLMPDVDGIGSGSLPEDECSHFFFRLFLLVGG